MDDVLQPGESIRPQLTEDDVSEMILQLYGLKVNSIKQLESYDDRNYLVKVEKQIPNENIQEPLWEHGYTFKVLNSLDSKKKHVEAECGMQTTLHKDGFSCPLPVKTIDGQQSVLKSITNQGTEKKHIVRLLTFIPGKLFKDIAYSSDLLYEVGAYIGKVDVTLQKYSHTALTNHHTIWKLSSLPEVEEFLFAIKDPKRNSLASEVMKQFSKTVMPKMSELKAGVIHGDFNEQNILVSKGCDPSQTHLQCGDAANDDFHVSGVIDFGDSSYGPYIFEAAITITYMMLVESRDTSDVDLLEVGGHVMAGYLKEFPLSKEEFLMIKLCISARYVQSMVMGAYSYTLDPGNEYVLTTGINGWPQLERFWSTPDQTLYDCWNAIIEQRRTATK